MAAKIKIRLKNGKAYSVKDASFVEICNDAGDLACLVYMMDSGWVKICEPSDPEFSRYLAAFKGKGIPMTTVTVPEPEIRHKKRKSPF